MAPLLTLYAQDQASDPVSAKAMTTRPARAITLGILVPTLRGSKDVSAKHERVTVCAFNRSADQMPDQQARPEERTVLVPARPLLTTRNMRPVPGADFARPGCTGQIPVPVQPGSTFQMHFRSAWTWQSPLRSMASICAFPAEMDNAGIASDQCRRASRSAQGPVRANAPC